MFVARKLRHIHNQRTVATLVLSEHFNGKLNNNLSNVLTAVKQLNDSQVDVLIHGEQCANQVEEV